MDNSEPAFPMPSAIGPNDMFLQGFSGMTLRDYFAAKALQGMLSGNTNYGLSIDGKGRLAYSYADIMLKARQG